MFRGHSRPLYALVRLGGKILAKASLSHIRKSVQRGQSFHMKSRRWYTPFLIFGANTFLNLDYYVLPKKEWLVWEPAIYRLAHGWEVQAGETGQLKLPDIPGVVLANLLKAANYDAKTKREALASAIGALRELHQIWVRFPDGVEGYFSHGDATVQNVIYDTPNRAAYWFDFETVHDSHRPPEWRHADDLRALTYSAVACLPEQELAEVAKLAVTAYVDPSVLRVFRRTIERLQQRTSMFHLAQADISYKKKIFFEEILQAELAALRVADTILPSAPTPSA